MLEKDLRRLSGDLSPAGKETNTSNRCTVAHCLQTFCAPSALLGSAAPSSGLNQPWWSGKRLLCGVEPPSTVCPSNRL